ncbi:MAG TPA: ATP-binding protein [Solirubrobacterales bacterium]|nr:ATP-binding protein [Solirubrobacterales bacterium]
MAAIARSEPFREQACPVGVCDGSGWILGPEDVARPCECRATRMSKGRSRGIASAIPARYRGVSFDRPPVADMARDLTARLAVEEARDYIQNLDANIARGKGLWFMGGTGTGKTTLAMLIASEAMKAGRTVGIYFTPKLLTRIRQTYQEAEHENAYARFFERVTSVDLLYIDDLGSERRTDWVVEQLYAVVNERYENQRPMLITSNAQGEIVDEGQQQLEDQIGRRTISRLIEICGDPLPLFGPDHRYRARPAA